MNLNIKNLLPSFKIMKIHYLHKFIEVGLYVKVPLSWSEEKVLDELNYWSRKDDFNYSKKFVIDECTKMSNRKMKSIKIGESSLFELEPLSELNTSRYNNFPRLIINSKYNVE